MKQNRISISHGKGLYIWHTLAAQMPVLGGGGEQENLIFAFYSSINFIIFYHFRSL